jgi:ribosomal protein S18 acetylase RimI-like enzyme
LAILNSSIVPKFQPEFEHPFTSKPASSFTFEELADIYNRARVDYIVPMPMNAKRMEIYVRSHDIDLDASAVVYDGEGEMAGVGMLGVRDHRAWITRVGVLPERRRHNLGLFLLHTLLDGACARSVRLVQLEVIKNNTPAYNLFLKLGFRITRELMVIRRPPSKLQMTPPVPEGVATPLGQKEVLDCLAQRGTGASWIEETRSLVQAGSLHGTRIEFPSGDSGWIVYQSSPVQLGYLLLHTPAPVRDAMTRALLYSLHSLHPMQDTKVENVPVLDLRWPVFQEMGYVEAFRRIEMFLYL